MRRVSAAWAAAAMVALGVVLTVAGPATAQVSCTGAQTASPATVSPASLLPGDTLTISGSGFAANQVLGIGLFRPPAVLASVASTDLGSYSATIQLPLGTPPGQNEITVFGPGPNSTCHQSLALFTVRELPAPATTIVVVVPTSIVATAQVPAAIVVQQPLARTGSASPALVAGGLVAMLFGIHLLRAAGRRPITG